MNQIKEKPSALITAYPSKRNPGSCLRKTKSILLQDNAY